MSVRPSQPEAAEPQVQPTIAGYRLTGTPLRREGGSLHFAAVGPSGKSAALQVTAEPVPGRRSRARFRRLARARAGLDHPALLEVISFGEEEGRLYVATEPLPALTLNDLLRDGPVEPARALRLLRAAAEGFDAGHGAGLVHLTLGAESLLLDGERMLLDLFGVFKATGQPSWGDVVRRDPHLRYESPEGVRGETLEPVSNVYSLTALLVHALTGAEPYPHNDPMLIEYAHLSEPPPKPSERAAGLPPELDALVARGMSKDPRERPTSATALIAEAERVLGSRGVASAVTEGKPMPARPAAATRQLTPSRPAPRPAAPREPKPARLVAPAAAPGEPKPARLAPTPAARQPSRLAAPPAAPREPKPARSAPPATTPHDPKAARVAPPAATPHEPKPARVAPTPAARQPSRLARPAAAPGEPKPARPATPGEPKPARPTAPGEPKPARPTAPPAAPGEPKPARPAAPAATPAPAIKPYEPAAAAAAPETLAPRPEPAAAPNSSSPGTARTVLDAWLAASAAPAPPADPSPPFPAAPTRRSAAPAVVPTSWEAADFRPDPSASAEVPTLVEPPLRVRLVRLLPLLAVIVVAAGFGALLGMPTDSPEEAPVAQKSPDAGAIAKLDAVRVRLRDELATAASPEDQASVADRLASAHDEAATAVRSPDIRAAAENAAAAYVALAEAARGGDEEEFAAANAEVDTADGALVRALRTP